MSSTSPKELECISRSAIPIKEHQRRVVNYLLDPANRGIVVAYGTGTGKTLTAVVTGECLIEAKIITKVIAVVPLSLKENFRKELRAYGASEAHIAKYYEIYTPKKFTGDFKGSFEICQDALFIVDEAHEIRKREIESGKPGKTATNFITSSLSAKKVLLLTATPVFNYMSDVLNLLSILNGGIMKKLPVTPAEKERFYRNAFTFFEVAEDPSIANDKPRYIEEDKVFTMTQKYYKEYLKVQLDENPEFKFSKVFLQGLRRATNALTPNPKVDWTINTIVQRRLKTLVFSSYRNSGINIVGDALSARGIPYVHISGDMSEEDRIEGVKRYNDNEVGVILITSAGSLGLDLKGTRVVIMLESSWNRAKEQQITGRAIRIGSHSHLPKKERFVEVYRLILQVPKKTDPRDMWGYSADEIINETSKEKEGVNKAFIDELKLYALE